MFIHSMGGYGILGGVRRYVSVTSFTRGSELAGGSGGGLFDVALGWGGENRGGNRESYMSRGRG